MTDPTLVPAGNGRLAITGVTLPPVPPTRIYIGDFSYRIVAPQIPLPPIVNVVKFVLNWAGPAARLAKNILFSQISGGTGSTSDPAFLLTAANDVMNAWNASVIQQSIASAWQLQSVTAKDLSGTTASATSTAATLPGLATGASQPPNSAVALSWAIAPSYRGGKPRTYLPGVPATALTTVGDSLLLSSYAAALEAQAKNFITQMNGITVESSTFRFGNVSYHHGHAVRPTPIFNPILTVKVHERVDSQRRRSGKESSFPTQA